MAIQLSARSQRLRSRQSTITHQFIVFQLRQEWFALPIQMAQKVIPLDKVYGAGSGVGLTLYQDREIPILDLQQRLFGTTGKQRLLPPGDAALPPDYPEQPIPQRFLLIMQAPTGAIVGLPLDSQPMLRRVPESAFTPLSAMYLEKGQIRCIKCLLVPDPEQPPIFLLNLDQLFQAQAALPGASDQGE